MLTRRRVLRGACVAAGIGAMGLSWRGCTQMPKATQGAANERVLRRGNGAEPETLDIHAARSEPALTLLRDLYEGLMDVGADGAPHLAAAERCEISADGCRYQFVLRANARWSNGDPVVADDFIAAWARLLDPHTGAQYAALLAPIRGATQIARGAAMASLGVSAPNPYVLVIELEIATPYFLSILTHPATFPLHRASLAQFGRSFAKPLRLISNGAFRLIRWDFGSHLVAVQNDAYWNAARLGLERVEYYSFSDGAAELRAYRSGALDTTNSVPPAQYLSVRAQFGEQLHISPQLAVYYLGFNMRHAPLGESRALRRALSLVIDRERIVESVTAGGERPAYTWVPQDVRDYAPPLPEYAAWPMQRRIAEAQRLVAEAGFGDRPLKIDICYNSSELHSRIALAVAQMWKAALGVETEMRAEEYKVLLQDIERGDSIQVFRGSWVADYDDPLSFLQVLRGGFSINLPRYAEPQFDALLDRAAKAANSRERRSVLQQAERRLLDDQPLIPVYFYVAKHLVSPSVQGWQNNAMNVVYAKNLGKIPPRANL